MFLTQIYRAQNENSRLVHICGAPENSVKSGTYFGYPGDWSSVLNKQVFTYALFLML